jgi:pyrroline-5-carboxylate reductase
MRINFIGAGHLPQAVIHALVNKSNMRDIGIHDKNEEQYKKFDNIKHIVKYMRDLKEAVNSGDIIFLAVLPNNFAVLLPDIKNLGLDLSGKIFVSTAAGITMRFIQEQLGQEIAVVRTMPNTPAMVGKGMTALCRNNKVGNEDFEKICGIFKSIGEIIVLGEEKMNKIIAVNGSSPAYVYLFAEAMLKCAAEMGFGEEEIYPAIFQSIEGSLEMLRTSGRMPGELIKNVAAPNGTTEKAMQSLYDDDFTGVIKKAMLACVKRADEMTKEFCE